MPGYDALDAANKPEIIYTSTDHFTYKCFHKKNMKKRNTLCGLIRQETSTLFTMYTLKNSTTLHTHLNSCFNALEYSLNE